MWTKLRALYGTLIELEQNDSVQIHICKTISLLNVSDCSSSHIRDDLRNLANAEKCHRTLESRSGYIWHILSLFQQPLTSLDTPIRSPNLSGFKKSLHVTRNVHQEPPLPIPTSDVWVFRHIFYTVLSNCSSISFRTRSNNNEPRTLCRLRSITTQIVKHTFRFKPLAKWNSKHGAHESFHLDLGLIYI